MGCTAYLDSLDKPTIGIGKLCEDIVVKTKQEMLSKCDSLIKICEKDPKVVCKWLSDDIDEKMKCISDFENLKKAYDKCSVYRKAILVSMCYQMGCKKVSTFKKALDYMYKENWEKAAEEMLDSDWHNKKDQSPKRAEDHAQVMWSNTCGVYCGLDGWI